MERNGTEQNRTELNRTEQNKNVPLLVHETIFNKFNAKQGYKTGKG